MIRTAIYTAIILLTVAASADAQTLDPSHNIVLGDVAASIIQWAIAAFGPMIAAAVLWLVMRLLKAAGLKNTDLLKDQLQAIIVNGINIGASRAQGLMAGKGQMAIKDRAAIYAVEYTQTHAAAIIKALGLDPTSGEAVQAIRARIETALADPTTPTSPVVTPTAVTETPKVAVVGKVT
jgi:hypothetical protein